MDTPYMQNTHPFARLFAVLFDLAVFSLPFEIAWIFWDLQLYYRCTVTWMGIPFALVQTFTALPFIALCLTIFGNTPGKALMGFVVVRDKTQPAGFTFWYKRTVDSFWRGLGGSVTLFMLPLGMMARHRLLMTGQTYWDSYSRTMVRHRGFKAFKTTIFVIIFCMTGIIKFFMLSEYIYAQNLAQNLV